MQTLAPKLPTMQLSHLVTSLEAVYQTSSSFLWSHKKALHHFFHLRTTQDVQNTL